MRSRTANWFETTVRYERQTEDDSYSAQWEIMVHVTDDGYEVMTY